MSKKTLGRWNLSLFQERSFTVGEVGMMKAVRRGSSIGKTRTSESTVAYPPEIEQKVVHLRRTYHMGAQRIA